MNIRSFSCLIAEPPQSSRVRNCGSRGTLLVAHLATRPSFAHSTRYDLPRQRDKDRSLSSWRRTEAGRWLTAGLEWRRKGANGGEDRARSAIRQPNGGVFPATERAVAQPPRLHEGSGR